MARRDHFRNSQKKQYRSQPFRNPYFQSKQIGYRHLIGISILGLLVVCAFTIWFFRNDHFDIQRVEVYGTKYISEELFSQTLRSYFGKTFLVAFNHQNRFVYDAKELQMNLEALFAFESISFIRTEQTLLITLVEKQSQMVWHTGGKLYVVDLQGAIIREFVDGEQDELPIFIDRNNIPVSVGSIVLTRQEIENIFLFHEHLANQRIAFKNTQVDRLAGKWIGVDTTDGYDILFDATGDIDAQAAHLTVILREKVTDTSTLDYIDLRFGDHVYFQ